MSMLKRILGMLRSPQAEWQAVTQDAPDTGTMLRSYLLPLCGLAPVATLIGMLVFDAGWSTQYGYSALRGRPLHIALATYLFQIASVYLLASVLYFLARTEKRSPSFFVALQVAVYGSIPVLLSGATLVIPFNVVFMILAMTYSFYLYYLGAERVIGIRPADSAMFIGVAMFCVAVLSTGLGGIASALGLL